MHQIVQIPAMNNAHRPFERLLADFGFVESHLVTEICYSTKLVAL